MPRLLNVVHAFLADRVSTEEARDQLAAVLAWPVKEADLRATWGMTPEAEAGQAEMMRLAELG